MQKYYLIIVIILINSTQFIAQTPLLIKKASADIFLSLDQNKSIPVFEIESLGKILSELAEADFEKEYLINKDSYDILKNHFSEFEGEVKDIPADSALVLFNQWYHNFSNIFYNYNKRTFFSSNNKKIILFSTSMSCYCTLEMCKNQLIDILKLLSQKRGGCPCSGRQLNFEEYDLLVVDTYVHNQLQLEYETLFAPSVIVLDSNNKVQFKIEYEDNMIDQLKNYLRGEI